VTREKFPEAEFFVDCYKKICQLEGRIPDKPPDVALRLRSEMMPIFRDMRQKALDAVKGYPSKSSTGKALKYFLNNYQELTLFTKHIWLPIDNDPQERLLRNPGIGPKTWYGTHSKRGARTAAILFSLVESCKLNKINPREYFQRLVADMHNGKPAYTPASLKIN
jgi:transposase